VLPDVLEARVLLSGTGSPDPSFNGGNDLPLDCAPQAAVMLPTGQALLACVVSNVSTGGSTALAVRLSAGGSLDPTFGSGGITADTTTGTEAYYGVAAEADGTVIEAGTSSGDLVLAGYNTDGSVDASFGTAGRVTVPVSGASDATAYGVTIDASGDIDVVGSAGGQFLADRFTTSGAQDPTFNGGAPLLFGSASDGDVLSKVAVEGDINGGDIVAVGASAGNVVVVQIDSTGALESDFGAGGIVTVPVLTAPDLLGQPDTSEGLALDPAGNIVVSNATAGGEFATARLISDTGTLDNTFGTGGIVTTSFGGSDDADFVAIQPDGSQIIVGGTSTDTTTGKVQEALAAYTPAGALDTTFGTGGTELLSTGLSPAPALARPSGQIAPQAEGLGGLYSEQAFASLGSGELVVGAAQMGRATPSASTVIRLDSPAPTSASLPAGTLGATISASVPLDPVIGGAKTKASAVVTVSNPTSQTISGPATVTVLASLGQSLGGAVQLLALPQKLNLKPGAHKALRIKLSSFPKSLPGGNYFLIATVNGPDGTTTGASVATASLTIAAPFITILNSNLVGSPATIAPGKKLNLSMTVLNTGNVPVAGTAALTVSLSTSSTGAGGTVIATIPLRVKLKTLSVGTYRAKVVVPAGTAAASYFVVTSLAVSSLGDLTAADGITVSETAIDVS
jgi:uncharacterized delta-60 repeat protein